VRLVPTLVYACLRYAEVKGGTMLAVGGHEEGRTGAYDISFRERISK
jgi:hypothetical protein